MGLLEVATKIHSLSLSPASRCALAQDCHLLTTLTTLAASTSDPSLVSLSLSALLHLTTDAASAALLPTDTLTACQSLLALDSATNLDVFAVQAELSRAAKCELAKRRAGPEQAGRKRASENDANARTATSAGETKRARVGRVATVTFVSPSLCGAGHLRESIEEVLLAIVGVVSFWTDTDRGTVTIRSRLPPSSLRLSLGEVGLSDWQLQESATASTDDGYRDGEEDGTTDAGWLGALVSWGSAVVKGDSSTKKQGSSSWSSWW